MSNAPLKILSLGAGVQSTTLLLMSLRGELPRLDHCIFADTQSEPPAVYRHLERLKAECAASAVPLHTVTVGSLRRDAIAFRRERYNVDPSTGRKGRASIPLFVLNADGTQGRIRRQCTAEYKINPIERFIKRELLGIPARGRAPREAVVEQWLGITTDEARRAKPPSDKKREGRPVPIWWKAHAYPLMGVTKAWAMSDGGLFGTPQPLPMQTPWSYQGTSLSMDRAACMTWLREHYPDWDVPRSACVECPYRSNAEWQAMKERDPQSFAVACASDDAFRRAELDYQARPETVEKLQGRLVGEPFIHRSCRPLRDVDFNNPLPPPGPLPEVSEDGEWLFGVAAETECEGMCGV